MPQTFWNQLLGATVTYYDAGGIKTRAIEAGEGPPIVMLHGLGGHAESFVRNVMPLAAAGYHVYAIDAIGHGLSDKPTDVTYHTPTFSRHLRDFLDAIGADQAHIIGQSLGGHTGWSLALSDPDRVASLLFVTGAGLLLDDPESQQESREIHKMVENLNVAALSNPTREEVRGRLEHLMASPDVITDELLETRFQIYNSGAGSVMAKVAAEAAGEENRVNMITEKDLAATTVPVLMLWTTQNPTTPAAVAEKAAKLVPDARFELISDAGHWPQFEQAERFNEVVLDFLRDT